jgi:hypothetical protein
MEHGCEIVSGFALNSNEYLFPAAEHRFTGALLPKNDIDFAPSARYHCVHMHNSKGAPHVAPL